MTWLRDSNTHLNTSTAVSSDDVIVTDNAKVNAELLDENEQLKAKIAELEKELRPYRASEELNELLGIEEQRK